MAIESKKAALIETIQKIKDERVINQITIAANKDLIEGLIMSYLQSGADGNRVMYPSKVKDNLFSVIINSNVSFEEVYRYLKRVEKGDFNKLIRDTLFGNKATSFDKVKNCDPFIGKTFQRLLELTDGVGTTGAVAGKGEFLFIMLGADKGDVGDVLFEGEMAEVKGAGAKIVFSRQRGDSSGAGWKDDNVRILKETAKDLFKGKMTWNTGSPLSPTDVADFFDLNKNPDADTYNLDNFIKLHEVYLPKVFPTAGQMYIKKAISEMKKRFKTTLDTGEYTDIMVKMGFQQYLAYGRAKKLRSVLYFSEADRTFISIENVATSQYATSDYFSVTAGYLNARAKSMDLDKHKVINLASREILTRKKKLQKANTQSNVENSKKTNRTPVAPRGMNRSVNTYKAESMRSTFHSPIPLYKNQSNAVYHFIRVKAVENEHYSIVHNTLVKKSSSGVEMFLYNNWWKRVGAVIKQGATPDDALEQVTKTLMTDARFSNLFPPSTKKYFNSL